MQPIIEIKNIGKKYNITRERGRYVALRDVLTNVLKAPLTFLKSKAKQVTGLEKKEDFWALKNVSFKVDKGEIIGIIGANGAGKSTLLKILSQITPPTEGEIILRGRIGSLLEVGTGFHPELTGRENIFLNGAILGMKKREIAKKFDEIVEFAGIEKFLDTPVKYYSSGMYVRLAFSVAAHMDPDILVVDEVLAVGDAEFQKKCLGKMEEVAKKENRTILFVSHNLQAIERLCGRTIMLRKGKVAQIGPTREVINYYLDQGGSMNAVMEFPPNTALDACITKVSILGKDGPTAKIPINDGFSVEVEYTVAKKLEGVTLRVMFYVEGEIFLNSTSSDKEARLQTLLPGRYTSVISVPPSLFNTGHYYFSVGIEKPFFYNVDFKRDIHFEILNVNNKRSELFRNLVIGKIAVPLEYRTNKH